MMEFKHIQKMFWGRHRWSRGYFVATSGNVTDEVIMEYIRKQTYCAEYLSSFWAKTLEKMETMPEQ